MGAKGIDMKKLPKTGTRVGLKQIGFEGIVLIGHESNLMWYNKIPFVHVRFWHRYHGNFFEMDVIKEEIEEIKGEPK